MFRNTPFKRERERAMRERDKDRRKEKRKTRFYDHKEDTAAGSEMR